MKTFIMMQVTSAGAALRPVPSRSWRSRCLLGIAVGTWALTVGGCGGCGSVGDDGGLPSEAARRRAQEEALAEQKQEEAAAAAKTSSASDKPPEPPKPAVAKRQAAGALSDQSGEDQAEETAGGESDADEPQSPRLPPKDLSAWDDHDFLVARWTGDARLLPALKQRAQRNVGQENEAVFLASLLVLQSPRESRAAAEKKASPASGGVANSFSGAAPAPSPATLLQAVAEALTSNGTAAAREVLEQLLAGTLKTEDDKAAAEAVLKCLAEHLSAENEDLLFRALTEAEKLRPPGRGQVAAAELQKNALTLITPLATARLRVKVAQLLVDPSTPASSRSLLAPLVKEMRPADIDAHLVLCRSELTDAATKTAIEKSFTAYSADALACTLDIADKARAAASEREAPLRAARRLWSPEFAAFLGSQQQALDALGQAAPALLLASTIPTDAMRARLFRTLQRHWDEGPAGLRAAGFASTVLSDPGLLVVLKTVSRQANAGNRAPTAKAKSKSSSSAQLTATQQRLKQLQEERERIQAGWAKVHEELLRYLCKQFRAASPDREGMPPGDEQQPVAAELSAFLSFRLPADVRPAAAYARQWPGAAQEKLVGLMLDPMRIGYVRLEQKAAPTRVLSYYRRLLKNGWEHAIDNGIWLDGFQSGSAAGRSRSVDVLISRAQPGTTLPPSEEQELTIEILAVEVKGMTESDRVNVGDTSLSTAR